ncbi:shugoshin family protein [Aspergillus mulundensis]|uniref:Shugoshin C-terminal domain-containing protein n=1 Tax=Aspergillus mulundensis TaxID=1810919 RepID=A0A3D8SCC0_9EURO|nr:hypothetical protein DSM5745_04301 [Aspergillus mulundensis]RDW83975.1 hypothetical protein DSM5745_04301 [Aspergillus mulundensis]
MARLNESTASSEPIEILKRRFVRQNREIARVNSIQSLRIRSLESEVSHLLSENVSLREQIITLTQDLERYEAARTLHDGVYDVKARLDSKLVELSSLITELGSLPRHYSRSTRERAESARERQPKEIGSTGKVNEGGLEPNLGCDMDGRLPVILEDKFYPRHTLSAQELQEFPGSDTGTPISRDLEDPSEFPDKFAECDDAPIGTAAGLMSTNTIVDYTDEHSLPPNLETRRKKKICTTEIDNDQADSRSTSLLNSKLTRKCGGKRKFSAEDEESLLRTAPAEDDGFQFSRPALSPRLSSHHEHALVDVDSDDLSHEVQSPRPSQTDHCPNRKKVQTSNNTISQVQSKRKVLEPKSTNVNVHSPMTSTISKVYSQNDQGPMERNQKSLPKQRKIDVNRNKNTTPGNLSMASPIIGNAKVKGGNREEKDVKVKSEVPSLHATEHSETAATTDMSNSRPSRRRGAVVSYAEPNLRDKMRRSTNELGPAVSGDKSRKSSSHPDLDPEPQDRKNRHNSTKQARNSSTANWEHDLIGNEAVAGHPHRPETTHGHDQSSSSNGPGIPTSETQAVVLTGRKSRRHSSNPKAPGHDTPTNIMPSTLSVENVCSELVAAYAGSSMNEVPVADELHVRDSQEFVEAIGSMQMTRGQRVAARRKSMML